MKFSLATIVMLFLALGTQAAGIEFFQGTWEEALAEAKKQDKIIFVDAFAVWCGPCKRMAKEVFPDAKVGEFYNKNFISMQIDMERGMGLEFGKKYPVSAYPTLFYIDYDGTVIQQVRGAQMSDQFIELGKMVLSKVDRSGQYAAEYEKGNRDPELVYNYIKALNKAGKPVLKIANDYLRTQKELNTDINLKIIYEGASEADSKIFDWLVAYKMKIAKLQSIEAVEAKIAEACAATTKKGIEFRSEALINEAVEKMKKHLPAKAESFENQAWMDFYLSKGDADNYVKACKNYVKKSNYLSYSDKQKLAYTLISKFNDHKESLKFAEILTEEAAKESNSYMGYLTYAEILHRIGKKEKALEIGQKALELAQPEGTNAIRTVEMWLQKLQESD